MTDPWRSMHRMALAGIALLGLLIGTVGVWAMTAPLAGAVIAPGRVVVENNVRRIQHPTGGVVAEINVRDGDHVQAGAPLARLEDTNARATLALIDIELTRLSIRRERLEAERDSRATFVLPTVLTISADTSIVSDAMASETSVFKSRRDASSGQVSQLRERIEQSRLEIEGVTAQIEAKRHQKAIIKQELDGVEKLYAKNLVALPRVTALQREASRLYGEDGSLVADAARIRGRIAETELQIIQVTQDLRRGVSEELRDVEGKIADLSERRTAAAEQLARVLLRAPQSGIVHQSTIHTLGGVINPGEQVMLIIPENDGLVVEARIEPTMIDRLHLGQSVLVRFPAFDVATTPTIVGVLQHVAADLTSEPSTGSSYYTVKIRLGSSELGRLAGKVLVPGMPAESFIQTGTRTAFAYLAKPFQDQLARTFRY
jgi:HlyD family secretion protein